MGSPTAWRGYHPGEGPNYILCYKAGVGGGETTPGVLERELRRRQTFLTELAGRRRELIRGDIPLRNLQLRGKRQRSLPLITGAVFGANQLPPRPGHPPSLTWVSYTMFTASVDPIFDTQEEGEG